MRHRYLEAFLGETKVAEAPVGPLTELTQGGLSALSVTEEGVSGDRGFRADALPAGCTIRRDNPDPCPACRYVHGNLADREPCTRCGSTAWTVSLVGDHGLGRLCGQCARAPQERLS